MAPHTMADVTTSSWNRPYPREMGAFPAVSRYLTSLYLAFNQTWL